MKQNMLKKTLWLFFVVIAVIGTRSMFSMEQRVSSLKSNIKRAISSSDDVAKLGMMLHVFEINPKTDDCAICLDTLEVDGNSDWVILPCGHEFHRECINHALNSNGLCPICRKIINKDIHDKKMKEREDIENRTAQIRIIVDSVLQKLFYNVHPATKSQIETQIEFLTSEDFINGLRGLGIYDTDQIQGNPELIDEFFDMIKLRILDRDYIDN